MVFGNTSLHEDVVLQDVEIPAELAAAFGGPRHGIGGLRQRVGAVGRALTCSALKPQGVPPARLAELAARFARGGIDFVKDDHGLADQALFAVRRPGAACAAAVASAARRPGIRPATCRACPATSTGCAGRSRSRARTASTR